MLFDNILFDFVERKGVTGIEQSVIGMRKQMPYKAFALVFQIVQIKVVQQRSPDQGGRIDGNAEPLCDLQTGFRHGDAVGIGAGCLVMGRRPKRLHVLILKHIRRIVAQVRDLLQTNPFVHLPPPEFALIITQTANFRRFLTNILHPFSGNLHTENRLVPRRPYSQV